MPQIYTIEAYSPSLNQTVRQFDLANIINEQTTQAQATLMAERFAQLQNQQGYLRTTDWQPKVTFVQVGIATMDGYQFHTGG